MTNSDVATLSRPEDVAPSPWRTLAIGAVVGPALFTLAWLVLGFVSTGYTLFDHEFTRYSPISQPISGLGMGATAPYMNAAFVAGGILLVVGVMGVFHMIRNDGRPALRLTAAILLAMTGVGQVIDGLFNLEAVMPHLVGFALAAGTPVVGFVVAGVYFRTIPRWHRFGTWLLLGSPITLMLLVGFFLTFSPTADGAEHGVAGLVQRVLVVEVLFWFVAMGLRAVSRSSRAT